MNSKLRFVGVLSLLGVLAACASAPLPPEDAFFRLSPHAQSTGEVVVNGVIEIDRFVASGSMGNRPILFSEPESNSVSEYHYHYWIEPPTILLQSALVSHLRASGIATRVVTPEMRVIPDYTIRGRVIRLEILTGKNSHGVATFELTLRREKDGELLVLEEYSATIAADKIGVAAGVFAIEKAVNDVFSKFVADIRKSVS